MPYPISPDPTVTQTPGHRFRRYGAEYLSELAARAGLPPGQVLALRAVASVVPFQTTSYVTDELIDWSAAPDDPIFRLAFPQEDMLRPAEVSRIADLLQRGAAQSEIDAAVHTVRVDLAQHTAARTLRQVPDGPLPPLEDHGDDQAALPGVHGVHRKGRTTVRVFPEITRQWTRFAHYTHHAGRPTEATDTLAAADVGALAGYLARHPEITTVQLSGGDGPDPLTLGHRQLGRYLDPLLALPQLEAIRIDTGALAAWPQRFLTDPRGDADDTLRLLDTVTQAGKHLTLMAHLAHPRELEPEPLHQAVRRIGETGAVIHTQAPLLKTINDTPGCWEAMWRRQLRLGMIPHLMALEPRPGPRDYFAVPLARAYEIFIAAYAMVSGLCRTVRGPVMTLPAGKVTVDGIVEIGSVKAFVLHFTEAGDADLVGRPFFARYNPHAIWPTELTSAFAPRFPHLPPAPVPSIGPVPLRKRDR